MTDDILITITPPLELRAQWIREGRLCSSTDYAITKAARWGYEQRGEGIEAELQKARDEELEACCEEIRDGAGRAYIDESKLRVCLADDIWTARRPKPKSQAEEALETITEMANCMAAGFVPKRSDLETIRAALERLQELEALDG